MLSLAAMCALLPHSFTLLQDRARLDEIARRTMSLTYPLEAHSMGSADMALMYQHQASKRALLYVGIVQLYICATVAYAHSCTYVCTVAYACTVVHMLRRCKSHA